jgi:hypothetical protein
MCFSAFEKHGELCIRARRLVDTKPRNLIALGYASVSKKNTAPRIMGEALKRATTREELGRSASGAARWAECRRFVAATTFKELIDEFGVV